MTQHLLLMLTIFLLSFAVSYIGFLFVVKKQSFQMERIAHESTVFVFAIAYGLAFVLTNFFGYSIDDFVVHLAVWKFWSLLVLFFVLLGADFLFKKDLFFSLCLLSLCLCGAFLLPESYLASEDKLLFILLRLGIGFAWFVLAYFWFLFNGISGYFGGYNIVICLSLIFLGVLGGMPVFYAFLATGLLANHIAFLIFNWYPSKIFYSNRTCQIIGFVLGGIFVYTCPENLLPCHLIILSFFLVELLLVLIKKVLFRDRYQNMQTNCIYYQAHISGLMEEDVCFSLLRAQLLLVVFCCFQIYMPTTYTLFLISLAFALWYLHKLQNWNEEEKTFEDLKEDLKQDYENIKNLSGKE